MEGVRFEEEDVSKWKIFLIALIILIVIAMLVLYWFIPFNITEFKKSSGNSNFVINASSIKMQFYPNMRYPDSQISYRILDCPLQKQNDMENAFNILENVTNLKFYSVNFGEDITVTCNSSNKIEGTMFIAGEGGPTKIISSGNFNVILGGSILLIRDSSCPTPNVAIHELLHALGFDHSENENNIMYPVSSCGLEIGNDTIDFINEIYSYPSYSDLIIENVSANMKGKYLDAIVSIRNAGLKKAQSSKLNVYVDDEFVKDFDINSMEIGGGIKLTMNGTWIPQLDVQEIKFEVQSNFDELDKENNVVVLSV